MAGAAQEGIGKVTEESGEKKNSMAIGTRELKGNVVAESFQEDLMPSFKVRDDDVWVCSFPRSGTTMTQEITYLVMTLDFEKANTVQLDDRFPLADFKDDRYPYYRGLEYLDQAESPRMIKSHLHYFMLPEALKQGKGRVTTFTMVNGPWYSHVREFWEHRNDENVLFLQFEQVRADRKSTIRKIANFLGRDLSEDDVQRIFDHTSLETMKKSTTVNFSYQDNLKQLDKSAGGLINTGKVDGWKADVSEDLSRRIDEMLERELGHTDIKFP